MIKSKRILIIEDDPAFSGYLRHCLLGAEMMFVSTLKGALEQLTANRFDLVVADLMLDDWKGDAEAMLTMIGMMAHGAVVAAVTARVTGLPERGCNAAAYKVNLGNIDALLAFLREAEKNAAKKPSFCRPVEALKNFVAMNAEPVMAHA